MQQNIGWNFDNSYLNLSEMMASKLSPVPVKEPKLILYNQALAKELGLNFSSLTKEQQALIFFRKCSSRRNGSMGRGLCWASIWAFCNVRRW